MLYREFELASAKAPSKKAQAKLEIVAGGLAF
jgi:hypothetical protein